MKLSFMIIFQFNLTLICYLNENELLVEESKSFYFNSDEFQAQHKNTITIISPSWFYYHTFFFYYHYMKCRDTETILLLAAN